MHMESLYFLDTLGGGGAVFIQPLSPVPRFCDPMNCGPPGSFVHGIFQAGILERGAGVILLPRSGK